MKRRQGVRQMLELYRKLIEKGIRTLDNIPEKYRRQLENTAG